MVVTMVDSTAASSVEYWAEPKADLTAASMVVKSVDLKAALRAALLAGLTVALLADTMVALKADWMVAQKAVMMVAQKDSPMVESKAVN